MQEYATYMTGQVSRVTAHENDQMLIIFATEGWTEKEWDEAVPEEFLRSPITAKGWDHFTSEDDEGNLVDVWVVNK